MPTIVMQSTSPITAASMASGTPLTRIQSTFSSTEPTLPLYTTSFPKGANISLANLKHCSPHGMPTIVTHQSSPASVQPSQSHRPANTNQRTLPIRRIVSSSFRTGGNDTGVYHIFRQCAMLRCICNAWKNKVYWD